MAEKEKYELMMDMIHQSPPLDLDQTINDSWVKGKTIIITGGASGFGAAWLRAWAAAGANVIIGDVNVEKGSKLVLDARRETRNPNLHFVHCDVTSWQSQVAFFQEAVKLSPHGGVDTVIANAGIAQDTLDFEEPTDLDAPEPPPPNLKVLDVNIIGVMYTVHLALFYLPRNPRSSKADPKCTPATVTRDRHLLLVASVAGILPIPAQTLYGASKHAVVGLFRNLRATAFRHGVRVNMLTPWWIDTPIIGTFGRMMIAGSPMGKVEDVAKAASLFVSDPRIAGHCLCVGPKLTVQQDAKGGWELAPADTDTSKQRALWEVYDHDFDHPDDFTKRIVRLLNAAAEARGWYGWASDIIAAISYGLKSMVRR